MKVFISQKMRDKTQEEILKERHDIEVGFTFEAFHIVGWGAFDTGTITIIDSYKPELKFKDPITSLSQSLALLADADVVLVPRSSLDAIARDFMGSNDRIQTNYEAIKGGAVGYSIKGCELELLVAKSYGKIVYTYDKEGHFEKL